MPVYNPVNDFSATITTAAAQVTPGNTQSVTLSGVTSLPTNGKCILSVFRPRAGREPQLIERLRDWSGISGNTLTNATRVTGAALAENDIVLSCFDALLWATLASGGSFASPTLTGTVTADGATFALDGAELGTSGDEFAFVGTVDFSAATVTGLAAGFDIIVTTTAELVAAFVSGNAGKRIWVKGGTYTGFAAHLVIQTGMHIVFGGGGTGPVTLDFGDTAYYLRSHSDVRWGTITSTAIGISGGIGYDADGGGSGALPNETGWRVYINGSAGDYAYLTATTFSITPALNYTIPNGAGQAYPAIIAKDAAENVVLTGDLIVKGTSGTGVGTSTNCYFLVGFNWNTSGLTLSAQMRGLRPSNDTPHCRTALCNSIIGPRHFTGAGLTFTRTSGSTLYTIPYQVLGSNSTYQSDNMEGVAVVNNVAADIIFRHYMLSYAQGITIMRYAASGVSVSGSGGTKYHIGWVTDSTMTCVVVSGRSSGWYLNGTLMTTASHSSSITSQFSTSNGSSLGAWVYYA